MFKKWYAGDEVVSSDKHPNVISACEDIGRYLNIHTKAVANTR